MTLTPIVERFAVKLSLFTTYIYMWVCRGWDSNTQPSSCEAYALAHCLHVCLLKKGATSLHKHPCPWGFKINLLCKDSLCLPLPHCILILLQTAALAQLVSVDASHAVGWCLRPGGDRRRSVKQIGQFHCQTLGNRCECHQTNGCPVSY